MNNRTAVGHLTAFFTILVWGTTFISSKVLLQDFSPLELLFLRFILGYLALLLVYPHRVKTKSFKEELLFISAGLCGVTLYFLFENIALTFSTVSNVGVIVSIAPFFTVFLAHFFLKEEKIRAQFFIGFVLAMAGIILISFNGRFVLKLNPTGDILAVLAALVWAIYSILMRKISDLSYHNIGCTRKIFFYGLIFMLPALPFMGFDMNPVLLLKPENLLNLLFLGLGASALCFVTWNWTIGVLGTVRTSVYIYIVPVVAIAASVIFLHEKLTVISVAGTLLTLVGLVLSERRSKAKRKDSVVKKIFIYK